MQMYICLHIIGMMWLIFYRDCSLPGFPLRHRKMIDVALESTTKLIDNPFKSFCIDCVARRIIDI